MSAQPDLFTQIVLSRPSRGSRKNRAERVIDYVTERPWESISALTFEGFAGRLSWRTAISEARLILEAQGRGTITNQRVGRFSLYRFEPK